MYLPETRIDGKPIQPSLRTVSYLGPRYLRERTGDFTDSRLTSKLGSLSTSHLALLPQDVSKISLEESDEYGSRDYDIHLTEIPHLRAGRENSVHEVQFGQLHISSEITHPLTELVAVKYLNKGKAAVEMHAGREINKRFGTDVSLEGIGFIRKPDTSEVGYLTRYNHSIVTLDNVLWNREANKTLREEAMGFAGLWLASLHNHQVTHGDAQAKNIAYDSTQMPRYVDLEHASSFNPDEYSSKQKRLDDVSDLFNQTFMPKTSPDENEIFIDAYLDQQERSRTPIDGSDIKEAINSTELS